MKPDQVVHDYRTLLKSVSQKIQSIDEPQFRLMGLEQKAQGMALIHARIVHLPAHDVWQQAAISGSALDVRVVAMREVDQLLGHFGTDVSTLQMGSVLVRLNNLVGGLPGDDPTGF